MFLIEIENLEGEIGDLQLANGQEDLADFRAFGRRLNAGSKVLMQCVDAGMFAGWRVELARYWANVSDATVHRANLEEWSPEQVRDFLGLDVEIPPD